MNLVLVCKIWAWKASLEAVKDIRSYRTNGTVPSKEVQREYKERLLDVKKSNATRWKADLSPLSTTSGARSVSQIGTTNK